MKNTYIHSPILNIRHGFQLALCPRRLQRYPPTLLATLSSQHCQPPLPTLSPNATANDILSMLSPTAANAKPQRCQRHHQCYPPPPPTLSSNAKPQRHRQCYHPPPPMLSSQCCQRHHQGYHPPPPTLSPNAANATTNAIPHRRQR